MKEKLLEIKSVSAGYCGQHILKNVSLTVCENDFIGIIGPNGGGKTTLLKVMIRLIAPDQGTISYYHKSLQGRKKAIGYLPQFRIHDRDFPITVTEVVCSGLMREKRVFSRTSAEDIERCEAIMDRFGIGTLGDRPIGELSGGQIQRAFLCRALISRPKILVLDEPDTFVDSSFAEDMHHILKDLTKEMAVVLVSHNIGPMISSLTGVACVNGDLHYHTSDEFSRELFESAGCPIHIVGHGDIPHTFLKSHEGAL